MEAQKEEPLVDTVNPKVEEAVVYDKISNQLHIPIF
jgi:hypothetical protein